MLGGSLESLHAGGSSSAHEKAGCVITEAPVSVWKLTWTIVGLRKRLSEHTSTLTHLFQKPMEEKLSSRRQKRDSRCRIKVDLS